MIMRDTTRWGWRDSTGTCLGGGWPMLDPGNTNGVTPEFYHKGIKFKKHTE